MRNNIKHFRLKKGYTQEQLAEKLGTTHVTVSRYENALRDLKIYRLEQIAKALDCTVIDLISDDFDNNIAKNTLNVKLMQHIIEITLIALAKRAKISIPSEEMAQLIMDIYKAAEGEEIANDDKMLEGYIYGRLSGESF